MCVLINLRDINPAHRGRTFKSDPSSKCDPESLLLNLSNAFQFRAYKIQHGKYGVIAHGDEEFVEKEFVSPLQITMDTTRQTIDRSNPLAGAHYAASFGIAARVKGEKQSEWCRRAREALLKATELRKNYDLTSHSYKAHELRQLRQSFIVTDYAEAESDDGDEETESSDDGDEEKQPAPLSNDVESLFPDDGAMIRRMHRICKTECTERKAMFVVMPISITKGAADYESVERIIADYKENKKCEVFVIQRDGARGYGFIFDDTSDGRSDVVELAEYFQLGQKHDLYRASIGIARRAEDDEAVAWFHRANGSVDMQSSDARLKERIGTTKKGRELYMALPRSKSTGSDGD